jgi:hypothetical protein
MSSPLAHPSFTNCHPMAFMGRNPHRREDHLVNAPTFDLMTPSTRSLTRKQSTSSKHLLNHNASQPQGQDRGHVWKEEHKTLTVPKRLDEAQTPPRGAQHFCFTNQDFAMALLYLPALHFCCTDINRHQKLNHKDTQTPTARSNRSVAIMATFLTTLGRE